jgi:hypothetical protein
LWHGYYIHFRVNYILEPTYRFVLSHPKCVKAIKGKKTDKRDAKWISNIFKHDLLGGSFIPQKSQLLDFKDSKSFLVRKGCLTSIDTKLVKANTPIDMFEIT